MNKKSTIESVILGCMIITVCGHIAVNGGFISLHSPSVGASILKTTTTPKIPQPTSVTNYTSQTNMNALYQYALQVVNADRQANGLNPVALSSIGSGQNHADDQLNIGYLSHWNSNGVKPYVTYTIFGGRGAMV